ncbi:hypothetical protein D1871_10975 [Nakamurella silvestris]|nr:hypothetical protein D1871_10975 [Nakamurella silvestris]
MNGRAETDKFRDYWISKSGKDATKADWDATYRNWMRRANEQAPGRPTGAVSTASTGDQRLAAGLELHAKYAAAEAASEAPELERTP